MPLLVEIVVGLLVGVALLALAAFLYYTYAGWTPFSYAMHDQVAWVAAGGKDASYVRFKNCVFTITKRNGTVLQKDVTATLNGMARAFDSGISQVPAALRLTDPLDPMSFTLRGSNDRATTLLTKPSVLAFCNDVATVTLVGQWRTL